jgi:hypothetical protein
VAGLNLFSSDRGLKGWCCHETLGGIEITSTAKKKKKKKLIILSDEVFLI